MQLIKLVYISDGWSLALLDRPLSNEVPEAWQYGPVYRSVYNAFSGVGARPVATRACVEGTSLPIVGSFADDEESLIQMVVKSYGKLSAFALSNLTHQSGTPWSKAFENGVYSKIDTDEMRNHFESLKAKRLAAA
jgi:uncharacterized phage-associated protein